MDVKIQKTLGCTQNDRNPSKSMDAKIQKTLGCTQTPGKPQEKPSRIH